MRSCRSVFRPLPHARAGNMLCAAGKGPSHTRRQGLPPRTWLGCTHSRISSSLKGGEEDQQSERTGVETHEPERPSRAPQQLQGHHYRPGQKHDGRAAGVHPELRLQARSIDQGIEGTAQVKRAVLYMRVSTVDQHPETQLHDLRTMAAQRGYQIVAEVTDKISGAKARRPGLDELMREARRGRFDVVLVWACDRIARSTRHFLEILDEFNRLEVEFISFRESIDTGGPLGRAIVTIIGAVAELERNLIVERVRAGMRRAKLEGQHIGRRPLELDREAILRDRHD